MRQSLSCIRSCMQKRRPSGPYDSSLQASRTDQLAPAGGKPRVIVFSKWFARMQFSYHRVVIKSTQWSCTAATSTLKHVLMYVRQHQSQLLEVLPPLIIPFILHPPFILKQVRNWSSLKRCIPRGSPSEDVRFKYSFWCWLTTSQ